MNANPVSLTVFLFLFALVPCLGFVATRWRKADLHSLHEWGLGGRSFGTLITWFLLGGDLYTAYTFIAVPALMFGAGATGFFAVPYTILMYPVLFLCFPRLWAVARKHGYVTAADFVRGRFGNRLLAPGTDDNLGQGFGYASLAVGSLLALFLYPHSLTGLLSSASSMAIRRNAILLPIYSLALALLALLGYTAVAAGVKGMPEYASGFASFGNNFAIPALFLHMFPPWFAGVAFAAIAIGALVPASIMAIASGNLFTRNIYKEFIAPDCSPAQEARAAKLASLMLKLGALFFVLLFQTSYAIQLQLLGGICICQTLPAVVIAPSPRSFNPWGLLP